MVPVAMVLVVYCGRYTIIKESHQCQFTTSPSLERVSFNLFSYIMVPFFFLECRLPKDRGNINLKKIKVLILLIKMKMSK